jgi:hypothetical protein
VEMAIFERLRFENSLSTATEFLNGCWVGKFITAIRGYAGNIYTIVK